MIDNKEVLIETLQKLRAAQKEYATFTQEQVDVIFKEVAIEMNKQRVHFAKLAVEETGMGVMEDKVIKNHYAAEMVYNKYRDAKTCGTIEKDVASGIRKVAEPIGVIAAVIPTTNPTSTAIFKAMISLKTRNAVFFAPHPRAAKCTKAVADLISKVAVKHGAPEGLIATIDVPSVEMTQTLMQEADIILATGGPGMVKAAYSSGTPAYGVGAGNTPAVIHPTADIELAVNSIILSKTFDNGVICASEQSVIVNEAQYKEVKNEFIKRGCHFLNKKELEMIRKTLIIDGRLNAKVVGQSAQAIAELAGFEVDPSVKILIGEVSDPSLAEPLAHEKLSLILAMYKVKDHTEAIEVATTLINHSGLGHTASIFIDDRIARDDLHDYRRAVKTTTVLVNQPSSQGAIGDLFNFSIAPSLTLGCGTWGNNSVSDNVGVMHLVQIKTVSTRRENMQWFKIPKRVYHKFGSLAEALKDLNYEGKKRVFIVTDAVLHSLGYTEKVVNILEQYNIHTDVFTGVDPDPTFANVHAGVEQMNRFRPDAIIALGGGSPMDAAKIMWLLYEQPETNIENIAMTFMDVRKRIYKFPQLGKKASLVCIPTTAGTGSEVTPFAVITDEVSGVKYPLADYEITPDMAIVDPELMISMPGSLTAASGIDVLTHALESLVSVVATDYTIPYSLEATKLVFENLEESYKGGAKAINAKEHMANASCIAGMAFSNAFLGICHSLAHKLGNKFKIPHGIANAMLMNEVIKYNATDAPYKQAAFSQYKKPESIERYAKAARYVGLTGKNDMELVNALVSKIDELKQALDIPMSIKEYGVNEQDFIAALDELVEQAFNDQCTGANPVYPKFDHLREIYLKAYYGENQ